jgi:archaetidylinositol phosphate synthase
MVLNQKRHIVDPILTWIANIFLHLHADIFTWLALLFAGLAGLFFYLSTPNKELTNYYLFFASLFVFLNGLFDALDGKIAKLTKTSSPRGDFLDHALDRYADVFIVGGITLSQWCDMRIGILALIGILLTSYMGTQSQAVGFNRLYAGLLGRADRLVILMIIPIVQHILLRQNLAYWWDYSMIEWALLFIAIIGNFTALQRFYAILKYFKK